MKKKDIKKDEEEGITVKVQSMFPNCQKYESCCKESRWEETVKKAKKTHNFKEMIEDMLESAKEKKDWSSLILIILEREKFMEQMER